MTALKKTTTQTRPGRRLFFALWVILFLFTTAQAQAENMQRERRLETATFAGGCFWCMEHAFDDVEGVVMTTSGYIGGSTVNPEYRDVSAGGTGHTEAVQVEFNPKKISYDDLLEVFWHNIDPTVSNRQFCDRGSQYRSGIFYHDEAQKKSAFASKAMLEEDKPFKDPIVTEITEATQFYPAEEYHQDYHHKNPIRYQVYRYGCGRDQRLSSLWGDSK